MNKYLIRFDGAYLVEAETQEQAFEKFGKEDNGVIVENINIHSLEAEKLN